MLEFLRDLVTEFPIYLVAFLSVITVVVFVHELGHFLVARWVGVRIEVFSIGFGRELFGFYDRHGTRWKFCLLPLGGYVKMFGEADELLEVDGTTRPLTHTERSQSFFHKSLARRSAVVIAGPVANYIFAIVVLAVMFMTYGQPFTAPIIGEVNPESAAERAGLEVGDRIVSIDGQPMERFEDIAAIIQFGLGEPVDLVYERDGAQHTMEVQPDVVETDDNFGNVTRIGRLGIKPASATEVRMHGPLQAVGAASVATIETSQRILAALWQMVEGTRSTEEIGGPLRIGKMAGDILKEGVVALIGFAAWISVMLGLFNLFPIPMLDGGHLAFYAYEAVRGRPAHVWAQDWALKAGIVVLVGMAIFALHNDLKLFDFFKNLLT